MGHSFEASGFSVTQFLRNITLACLGLMLLVGVMTASMFIGLLLLAVITGLWICAALRRAGVVNPPRSQADNGIIEAEYEVIEEKETRIPQERV